MHTMLMLCFSSSFFLVFAVVFASAVGDEDVAPIDAATAAKLRRIAELVPPLQFRRGFAQIPQRPDWMSGLPKKITTMPLSGIAIPGSHDSFTTSLDYKAELGPSPDLSKTLIKVIKFFGKVAKKIIYNWGVTQSLTLTEQLNAGIRYFDFRVAKRESKNGEIYLLHSLYAQSVADAFQEVLNFLNKYDKEVVIIDINHFYGLDTHDHQKFAHMILNTFGNRLVIHKDTTANFSELTLANLWPTNQRVVLIYHDDLRERDPRLMRNYWIASPWLQTNSRSEAVKKLNIYYGLNDPIEDGFWVTQGVLSPSANNVIWGAASSLKSKLGVPMCKVISKWVKDKKIGKGGLNIVITDFVEEHDFIGNVIGLNLK